MKKTIISIYGRPAAGKTTQAEKIKAKYGFEQFGMGDVLRGIISSGSELGQKIKPHSDAGTLIPDELMIQVIQNVGDQIRTGLTFDGFPRMLSQAHMLKKMEEEDGLDFKYIFYLNISATEAQRRVNHRAQTIGGRIDDSDPKAVANRLDVFSKESIPLLEYYREMGRLIEIDGEKSIEEVFEEICKYLD